MRNAVPWEKDEFVKAVHRTLLDNGLEVDHKSPAAEMDLVSAYIPRCHSEGDEGCTGVDIVVHMKDRIKGEEVRFDLKVVR